MTALASLLLEQDAWAAPRLFNLQPGEVGCGQRGDRLSTLLGSCVAVVLTDPHRTVGAMCHVVHAGGARAPGPGATAYAHEAFEAMFLRLAAHGIVPRLCEAFVFGGANMFPALYPCTHVGERNALSVLQLLNAEGIRVIDTDLGGFAGRQVDWTVGRERPQVRLCTLPLGPAGVPI